MAVHLQPRPAPGPLQIDEAGLQADTLTATQLTAIQAVMRTFADDDLASGVGTQARMYCHACQQGRAMAGFIDYGKYQLCNGCATEYEVARARGLVEGAGRYVRDKVFGEGSAYVLNEK